MCPIYCTPFTYNETICKLPCNHVFTKDGIYTWLKESHLCPVCRFELDFVEVKDNNNNNITASSEDNDTGTGITNETDTTSDISNQFAYVNNYPSFNLVNILLQQQELEQLEYQQAILRSLSEN